MIIGLYVCVPLFKPIVKDDSITKYYLTLSFLFTFLIPEAVTLIYDFGDELLIAGVSALKTDVDYMYLYTVLGYGGYFIAGYYLNKIELNKRQRIIVYLLGVFGFAFTGFADYHLSMKTQIFYGHYFEYRTVNVLLEAMAVFTWFKYRKYDCQKLNGFIRRLSKYCFGAYLVHVLVIEQLNIRFGLNTLTFGPVISVAVIFFITVLISFGISAIMNRVPVIKKYIV